MEYTKTYTTPKLNIKSLVKLFLIVTITVICVGGVSLFPLALRTPLIITNAVITAAFIIFRQKKVFLTMPVVLMLLTVAYLFISLTYTIDSSTTMNFAVIYLCSSVLLLADYPESLFESALKGMQIVCIVIAFSIILSSFIDNCMLKYFWFMWGLGKGVV